MLHPCAKIFGAETPISGPKWGHVHGAVPPHPLPGEQRSPPGTFRVPQGTPPNTPTAPSWHTPVASSQPCTPALPCHTHAHPCTLPHTHAAPPPPHAHPLPTSPGSRGRARRLRSARGTSAPRGHIVPRSGAASFLPGLSPSPARPGPPGAVSLVPCSRVTHHRHHLAAGFAQKASSFRCPLPCPGSRRVVQTKHFHSSTVPNARVWGFPAPCPCHRNVPDDAGTCGRAAPGAPCRAAARPRRPLKITQIQLLPVVS